VQEGSQPVVDLVQTTAVNVVEDDSLRAAGLESPEEQQAVREAGLADLLINDFVLPFEAVSVLLLAAVIGALALVRPRNQ
jgi:NADH:ubiquinone oxidoreductase subunit 6 (subunit J)